MTWSGGDTAVPPPDPYPRSLGVSSLGQEVVRVRHLERTVGGTARQIAELVAEVRHDVVPERLDVCARGRLVVDRRTRTVRVVCASRLQVVGVVHHSGLREQAVLAVVECRWLGVASVDANVVGGQISEGRLFLRLRATGKEEDGVPLALRRGQ